MIFNEIKDEINEFLKNYFNNKGSYNKIIYDSASYSLNIGGKRIRPMLMLLTYNTSDNLTTAQPILLVPKSNPRIRFILI